VAALPSPIRLADGKLATTLLAISPLLNGALAAHAWPRHGTPGARPLAV
jgi:hypothetical protein